MQFRVESSTQRIISEKLKRNIFDTVVKMKSFFSIFMLIAALIAITNAHKHNPHSAQQQGIPHLPGHGPFNPNQPKPWGGRPVQQHRFRRSDEDKKNRVKVEGERSGGSSSYNVDYGRTVHESRDGKVVLHGGMHKDHGGRPDKHIGIQGEWRY